MSHPEFFGMTHVILSYGNKRRIPRLLFTINIRRFNRIFFVKINIIKTFPSAPRKYFFKKG